MKWGCRRPVRLFAEGVVAFVGPVARNLVIRVEVVIDLQVSCFRSVSGLFNRDGGARVSATGA